jgi:hypothetical protein
MGDALAHEYRLEWKIINDEIGTDLGLWRSKDQIVLSPTTSIAKRFADEADGLVVDLGRALRTKLRGIDGGDFT